MIGRVEGQLHQRHASTNRNIDSSLARLRTRKLKHLGIRPDIPESIDSFDDEEEAGVSYVKKQD